MGGGEVGAGAGWGQHSSWITSCGLTGIIVLSTPHINNPRQYTLSCHQQINLTTLHRRQSLQRYMVKSEKHLDGAPEIFSLFI